MTAPLTREQIEAIDALAKNSSLGGWNGLRAFNEFESAVTKAWPSLREAALAGLGAQVGEEALKAARTLIEDFRLPVTSSCGIAARELIRIAAATSKDGWKDG